jgi:hypothetical protein
MKKKTSPPQNNSLTCPNPSCGRVFTNPVKVENLGSKGEKVYDACPYCLTEITLKKDSEPNKKSEQQIKAHPTEKASKPSAKVEGCPHFFGYLSKRSAKEKIPEGCLTCGKIVECMLQSVTS